MGKAYRPYLPDQDLLLPPSLRDWLPENHLVYFVSDVVDQLDLSAIEAHYEDELRGQPPYDPRLMTKLLIYAYCVGVFSSRKIHKRLMEDVSFKVLAAGNEPDFRTIADFRKIHLKALEGLFEQVLKITLEAGIMKLGRVALDGTKVKANASKHKAMSYGRMEEKEKQIRAEVKQLLAQAEAVDQEEDAQWGMGVRGDELPAELQRRESRLKKIRMAKRALEERAREEAAAKGKAAEEVKEAQPADKDQYNFTDAESRIMMGADGFVQGYNAQAAVDSAAQVIVAAAVTQETVDNHQLLPMLHQVEENLGRKPQAASADAGYWSEDNATDQSVAEIDLHIATGRDKHGETPLPASSPGLEPASAKEAMRHKLRTEAGRAVYKMRKAIVEPVFGQIKEQRGFRRFSLRGLNKVGCEWKLVCAVSNLRKLYGSGWTPQVA